MTDSRSDSKARWCSRSLALFASLAAAQSVLAQAQWSETPAVFANRFGHSVVTDPQANAILFGGVTGNGSTFSNELFTFDGAAWTQVTPAISPPARTDHAAAFDGNRGRMIVFGGRTSQVTFGDTWEWDGATWSQVATTGPSPRSSAQMAHMFFQQRTVLYGGTIGDTETWTYDGSTQTWTQVTTATQPPRSAGETLTYDGPRDVALLIVSPENQVPGSTWEFDGVDWTQQAVGNQPNIGLGHSAFQAAVPGAPIVAIGGLALGGGILSETWLWDGGTKTWALSPAVGPAGRFLGGAAVDANGSFLLVGGLSDNGAGSDTWSFDGMAWSRAIQGSPPSRTTAMVSDGPGGVTVVHGGASLGFNGPNMDTWTWDGTAWTEFAGANPGPRLAMGGAFDATRSQLVAFGGIDNSIGGPGPQNDTWEFDGTAWNLVATANAPSARAGSAMAFDANRGVVVLFGGFITGGGVQTLFADTWEYDGVNWVPSSAPSGPPQMETRAMAFDSVNGVCVLLGRPIGGGPLQTWQYGGTNWASITTATVPPNVDDELAMAYDALRNRIVVIASDATGAATWELNTDGAVADWVQRTASGSLPNFAGGGLAYDPMRQMTVQFGGLATGVGFSTSVFEYGVTAAAAVRTIGTSCAGTLGAATCAAAPGNLPWLGTQFTTQVTGMAPSSNAILVYGFNEFLPPVDLGVVIPSLAGCFLYADNVGQEPLVSNAGGTASALPLQISTDPIMIGFTLYAQAFPLGPAQLIDSTTNAIELTLQMK